MVFKQLFHTTGDYGLWILLRFLSSLGKNGAMRCRVYYCKNYNYQVHENAGNKKKLNISHEN